MWSRAKTGAIILSGLLIWWCGCATAPGGRDSEGRCGDQLTTAKLVSYPRQIDEIEITYCWGVECRNRVDTISGTLTKDLIADGAITVPFELSGEQKEQIVAYADSIKLWHWPDSLFNQRTDGKGRISITSPCEQHVLVIRQRHRTKTIVWGCKKDPDNPSPLWEIIKPLGELIEGMVFQSEEYLDLPQTKGTYI